MQTEVAKLIVAFEAQTAQLNRQLDVMGGRVDAMAKRSTAAVNRVQGGFTQLTKYLKGYVGLYLVTGFFRAVITQTKEAEESFARLKIAVQNNGRAATKTAEQYQELAHQLQGKSIFKHEEIEAGMASLLKFKDLGVPLEKAIQLSIDLASRLGIGVPEAAKLLGKALGDPTKALRILKEAGVVFNNEQKKMLKYFEDTGQRAKASQYVFDELSRSTVGAAAAMRDNFSGALTGLSNDFHDLLEAKAGLPGLTQAINDLDAVMRDPDVKAGADALLGGILRVVTLIVKGLGEIVSLINMLPKGSLLHIPGPIGTAAAFLFGGSDAPPSAPGISGPHPRGGTTPGVTFSDAGDPAMAEYRDAVASESRAKVIAKATAEIEKQIAALRMQVLAFGASEAGAAGLEATEGDLGKTLETLGPAGDALRLQYVGLAVQLQELKEKQEAENAALEASKQLHEDIAAALDNAKTEYQKLSEQVDVYVGWLTTVDETTGKTLITVEQYYELVKKASEGLVESGKKAEKAAEEMSIQWDQALRNMQGILADALFNSFDNGVRGMLFEWANALKRMAAEALAANIFGALTAGAKSASGGGGFFSGLLGAFLGAFSPGGGAAAAAGGGGVGSGLGDLRADGGPIRPNKWYMVGEQGPELIRTAAHGMVLPSRTTRALMSGERGGSTPSRAVSVTMNITTPDADSFMRTQQQIQARMSSALTRASARNN